MRRFILIRHSAPIVRPELPSETWQLSAEGHELAALLADDLAEFGLSAVLSSSEPKAIDTARAIGRKAGLRREVDSRFNEQRRANAPYLGSERFRAAIAGALRQPDELLFGEETVSSSVERFTAGIELADSSLPDGDIAVVSHGTVITGFVGSLLGIDPVPVWQELGLPGYIVINWPNPTGIESQRNFDG
jgi:broad specificity phosphatase PhoE